MAESVDNFDDLNELCVEDANNSLTDQFQKAAKHLTAILSSLDTSTILLLYSYYKQGCEGSCNIPKPWFYDTKAKAKWDAWKKLGNMSQDEAKKLYIEQIQKLDPSFKIDENSKEQWVKVSSMQKNENETIIQKNIIDFIREGNEEDVMDFLKNYEGDLKELLNQVDESGLGLIHWATDRGFVSILDILLQFGANIDMQDIDGQSALHYASSCGHKACIKLLLSRGAKKELKDEDGLFPADVAIDKSVKELFK